MGFWLFMLVMDLLFPATMIGIGKSFQKAAPKDINSIYGYRTAMSMKNRDTWEFAHRHCGRLWFRLGLILLPVNLIPMLLVIWESRELVNIVGSVLCAIDTVIIIATIFPTEAALKKTFDQDGNRRENRDSTK